MDGRTMKTEVDSFANNKLPGLLHSSNISSQFLTAYKYCKDS